MAVVRRDGDRPGVHLVSSLETLNSAVVKRRRLTEHFPSRLLKIVRDGLRDEDGVKGKKKKVEVAKGGKIALEASAESRSAKWVVEPLLRVRKSGTVRASAVAHPSIRVGVGDFVLLDTEDSVPHNYIMHVTEVYSDGITDVVGGYYVYRKEDIKSLRGCEDYQGDDGEVFLSHDFVEVSLSSVLGIVSVQPSFCKREADDFYYKSFFDHTSGIIHKMDFALKKPVAIVEFLWLNHQSRNCGGTDVLHRDLDTAMLQYCMNWRERPGGPRRNGAIKLKLLFAQGKDLLSLPYKGVLERLQYAGGLWVLVFKERDSCIFSEVFGEGALKKEVLARKAGGEELLKFTFFLEMRLAVVVGRESDGSSACTFAGVMMHNGAGVLQWNTRRGEGIGYYIC